MTPGRIVTPGDLAALEVQQVAEKPGAHDLRLDRHRMARDRDLVDVPVGLAIAAGDVLEDLAGGSHRLAPRRVGDGTEGTAAEVTQGVRLHPPRPHCRRTEKRGGGKEGGQTVK